MNAYKKIRLELARRKIIGYIIFFAIIFGISIILEKAVETALLMVTYGTLRYFYPKTWHTTTKKCLCSSVVCFMIFVIFSVPIYLSIFISILLGFLITYGLYILQDYIDSKKESNLLVHQLEELQKKTIWTMEDDELNVYLKAKGIKNERIDFVILILQGYTFNEIALKLGYAECTMKDWSKICKKKLNIKSWKAEEN